MIIGSNSDTFRNPSRYYGGAGTASLFNARDNGALKNSEFTYGALTSLPEGYGSRSWKWPRVLGSMSTFNNNPLTIIDNINGFALGVPMQAPMSGTIDNNPFQIALVAYLESSLSASILTTSADLIILQNITASITGNMTISNADLSILAAILMQANLTGGISITGADLGMAFEMMANLSASISSNSSLSVLLNLSADIGGSDPLSPEGLAKALLDSMLIDYQNPGSVGEYIYKTNSEVIKKLDKSLFIALK